MHLRTPSGRFPPKRRWLHDRLRRAEHARWGLDAQVGRNWTGAAGRRGRSPCNRTHPSCLSSCLSRPAHGGSQWLRPLSLPRGRSRRWEGSLLRAIPRRFLRIPSSEPTRVALGITPFRPPLWMAPPPLPVPPPQPEPLPPPSSQVRLPRDHGIRRRSSPPCSTTPTAIRSSSARPESPRPAPRCSIDSNEIELVDTAGSRTLALRPGGRP